MFEIVQMFIPKVTGRGGNASHLLALIVQWILAYGGLFAFVYVAVRAFRLAWLGD